MPAIILIFFIIIAVSMTTGIKVDKILSGIMNRGTVNFTQTEESKKRTEYAQNAYEKRALAEQAHLIAQEKCQSKSNSYEHLEKKYVVKYKYKGQESSCYATTTITDKNGNKTETKEVAYKVLNLPDYPIK